MAQIVRYQPFGSSMNRPSTSIDRVFERLFDDAFGVGRVGDGLRNRTSANLFETDDTYVVELPLPGVRAEDLEVTVREAELTINARRDWRAPEGAKAVWHGFGGAEWRQSFTLPGEVDADRVQATLDLGVLRLELPKAAHARARTIKINAVNASEAVRANGKAATVTPAVDEASA